MKRGIAALLVLIVVIGLLSAACGGGGSKSPESVSPTSAVSEEEAIKGAEEFFQNPPEFTVDLSEETIDDPGVPMMEMEIPETETGNLDVNISLDLNISATVPSVKVPAAGGLLTMPKLR